MLRFVSPVAAVIAALTFLSAPVTAAAQANALVYDVDAGIRTAEFDTFKPIPGSDGLNVFVGKDGWYSFVMPKGGTHEYMDGGNSLFRYNGLDVIVGIKPDAKYASFTPAQLDAEAEALMQLGSDVGQMAGRLGTVTASASISLQTDKPGLKAPKGAGINVETKLDNGDPDESVVVAIPSNRGVLIVICMGGYDACRSSLPIAIRLGYGAFVPSAQKVVLNANGTLASLPSPVGTSTASAGKATAPIPANMDIRQAPVANRGKEVALQGEAGGRTWTHERGWFTMRLGPKDYTELDQNLRYFTYVYPNETVDVAVQTETIGATEEVIPFDSAQRYIGFLIEPERNVQPPIVDKFTIERRYITDLTPAASGKTPGKLAIWVTAKDPAKASRIVIGAAYTPFGSITLISASTTAEAAEKAIKDNFRFATGLFEDPR